MGISVIERNGSDCKYNNNTNNNNKKKNSIIYLFKCSHNCLEANYKIGWKKVTKNTQIQQKTEQDNVYHLNKFSLLFGSS
jgi:hypothetical protein